MENEEENHTVVEKIFLRRMKNALFFLLSFFFVLLSALFARNLSILTTFCEEENYLRLSFWENVGPAGWMERNLLC